MLKRISDHIIGFHIVANNPNLPGMPESLKKGAYLLVAQQDAGDGLELIAILAHDNRRLLVARMGFEIRSARKHNTVFSSGFFRV